MRFAALTRAARYRIKVAPSFWTFFHQNFVYFQKILVSEQNSTEKCLKMTTEPSTYVMLPYGNWGLERVNLLLLLLFIIVVFLAGFENWLLLLFILAIYVKEN